VTPVRVSLEDRWIFLNARNKNGEIRKKYLRATVAVLGFLRPVILRGLAGFPFLGTHESARGKGKTIFFVRNGAARCGGRKFEYRAVFLFGSSLKSSLPMGRTALRRDQKRSGAVPGGTTPLQPLNKSNKRVPNPVETSIREIGGAVNIKTIKFALFDEFLNGRSLDWGAEWKFLSDLFRKLA